jgi:tetratricopeptide (TPR) repeat protein
MRRASNLFIVNASLLMFILPLVFLSSRAGAQDVKRREIRLKDKSARVGVTTEETSNRAGEEPNLWAVLIGVSRYKYGDQKTEAGEIPNLRYAEADARSIYDFLRSPEGGGFRDEREGGHMVLLTDEEATTANVSAALSKLKQAKPNDYFVIFIAAHGMIAPYFDRTSNKTLEDSYFALYDTDLDNLRETTIRMDAFRNLVKEMPAQKGVVLSDTCHSAGVQMAGRGTSTSIRANAGFIDQVSSSDEGVGFIWSASQTESALEPRSLRHGYFTASLLEGLSGNADADGNERITFQEVADFVIKEVPRLTDDKQHPYSFISTSGAKSLPLAVVPYAGVESSGGQYGTLVIRTPGIDGVEFAIDGEYLSDNPNSSLQRSVRVKSGLRNLSFVRAGKRTELQAEVQPRKSKLVEVNLAFSESNSAEDSLVDAPKGVLNVYLTEDKEPSKEAKELFQKGVDSFKKRKFQDAIGQLNEAIKANSGAYADAYVFLGRAHQTIGRMADAVDSYQRALTLKPSDYETETLLAEAKFVSGTYNVDEIIKQLERIKYTHPDYDYVRVVYADVLMETRRDYWGAERELRAAINSLPTSPPAHLILSQALTSQRSKVKQKQAVEEAQTALDLYEKISRKQVSFNRGLKRLSISHVIFGGGRFIDYTGMSDAHRKLAEACIMLTELDDTLADSNVYLDRARASIQESIKWSQKSNDKARLAMALDTSAQLYVRKLELLRAIQEAEPALNLTDNSDIKAELHYTLYSAYKSDQKFGKAVENLKKYISLGGAHLNAKEREALQAELDRLSRLKEANKQK